MVDSNKQLRIAGKGASIRKAGFISGIHALPVKIKAKLDELLLLRYSPEKALSILEKEFPDTNLPSKSAVYSYKAKYLLNSLTSCDRLSQVAESLDVEKMNTASLFLSHLRRFIAIDLNVLQDRWYQSLEEEHKSDKNRKVANEMGKMYMDGIKLSMDMLLRLNVSLDIKPIAEEDETPAEQATEDQRQLRFILWAKICYERQQYGDTLNDLDKRCARMYDKRLQWQLDNLITRMKQKQNEQVATS